jgi:hypothetical protein
MAMLRDKMAQDRQNQAQTAMSEAALTRQITDDMAKIDPAYVKAQGPDAARSQFDTLRRRLPAAMQAKMQAPNFASMDSPPEMRMGEVVDDIGKATSPEAVPSKAQLSSGLARRRLPTSTVPAKQLFNVGDEVTTRQNPTQDSDQLMALLDEAGRKRSDLEMGTDRKGVQRVGPGGEMITDYKTNRELANMGSVQSERTPGQEATRQGQIRQATAQAESNVATNPQNVRGFATREQAIAHARQSGQNTADKQQGAGSFASMPEVIEDVDPNTGNKVFKVIDKRASVGQSIATEAPSETATDGMRTAYSYGNRAVQAHNIMTTLEPKLMQLGYLKGRVQLKLDQLNAPEAISDPVVRQYAQAMRTFINAGLGRPESGAQISQQEYDNYAKTNAFTPGIDETTLGQVQDSRREAIGGLATRAGQRLGKMFVTMADIQADAADTGKSVDETIQEAESQGFRVVR